MSHLLAHGVAIVNLSEECHEFPFSLVEGDKKSARLFSATLVSLFSVRFAFWNARFVVAHPCRLVIGFEGEMF